MTRPPSNSALLETGYSLAIFTCGGPGYTPPDTCEAMKNAATTAGRLMSLRN